MKKVKLATAMITGGLALLQAVRPAEAFDFSDPDAQARQVMKRVFIDRAMDDRTFAAKDTWQLDQLRPYFAPELQAKIDEFLKQYSAFAHSSSFGIKAAESPGLAALDQFDPITGCDHSPMRSKASWIKTDTQYAVTITYRLLGARGYSTRQLLVDLEWIDGKWLIEDVQYLTPKYGAPMSGIDSMTDALAFLAHAARASTLLAAKSSR